MDNFLLNRSFKHKLKSRVYLGATLLLLLLLQSVASFAQKITLNYQNVPLEQVLREIRKQSGYDIFFDQTLVNQQPPVAVKIANADVQEAMTLALKGLPLSFTINGKTISIKKSGKDAATSTHKKGITVTGIIIDENGVPMAGVTIAPATLKPMYTDAEGKFTLKDIDPLTMVRIAYTGYRTIERTALAISLLSQINMEIQSISLNPTIIQGMQGQKLGNGSTIKVDLTHRRQLSLAAALQGTVPGLVIKSQNRVTTRKVFVADGSTVFPAGEYTREELLARLRKDWAGTLLESLVESMVEIAFSQGAMNGDVVTKTSIDNSGLIPEIRGAGGFGLGNNAILVVIDGFIQDDFPADYPLNNVLSLEVIRDPAETIKWGPRAANGVIIITTNGGKPGELKISYNSNFNFSAASDNSIKAMQRANTSQILDFEAEQNKLISAGIGVRPDLTKAALSPAQLLLEKRFKNLITEAQFQTAWNELAQLSNEAQYREQQQHIFSQTQNLNLSGGGKHNRFSINGNYSTSQTEALGNKGRVWGLNLRDQLSLFENKLQIGLQVNANLDRSVAGTVLDPAELEPYQMLYNASGGYVYDYRLRGVNEVENQKWKTQYPGLQDWGYNPLEEARGTNTTRKGHRLNSSLNVNWKLLDGLTWSTNLQYLNSRNNIEKLVAGNTNYARNQYNNYYAVATPNPLSSFLPPIVLNPAVAYMPKGDIFEASQNRSNTTNLRTGFTYSRVFDQKHAFNLGFGFSYFNQLSRSSRDQAIYGYNSNTGLGTALSLPDATAPNYLNAVGTPLNFNFLSAIYPINRSPERNMSTNGSLNYTYNERLGLQAFYNQSFMPIPSADIYSSTRNYNTIASWALHKESFFKVPVISKLKLSAGFGEIKMASLPVNLPASRVFQPDFGTTALVVSGYNTVRQNGEQIRNYDGLLDVGLFKDVLQGQLNYRYNSMGVKHQWSGRVSYHISKANYFNLPFVSNLMLEGLVTNISPAQALAQMMSTNSPLNGGGFSAATGNFDLGALPPHVVNREIRLVLGLWKDRINVDTRYYNRSNSGMANGSFQVDLSSGFGQRSVYSRMDNKGYELYIQAKIIQGDGFTWTSTVNGAYNINQAKNVVKPLFDISPSYLTANREGYATGSLWSLRWAGLNNKGNPQVFDPSGKPVEMLAPGLESPLATADQSWLTYSGRTTPPWAGAFIQEFGYKGFYARATLRFALGHVMRSYRPVISLFEREQSNLIAQRWRQPGDEAFTDIPGIFNRVTPDPVRGFATQNSDNSIVSADFFKLSEIQLGYDVPASWLKGKYVKSLNLALNLSNVATWTRNKLGIDPETVYSDGRPGVRQPLRYGLSLFAGL